MSEDTEPELTKKEQLQQMLVKYGTLAFAIWWGMFFLVSLPIAALAFTKGGLSLGPALAAGWAGAQPTKPIRFGLMFVLTPLVARWIGKEPASEPAA